MDEVASDAGNAPLGVSVPARWFIDPMSVPSPVNALLLQVGAPAGDSVDTVYLTFGHINPPLIEGPAPSVPLTPDLVEGMVLPVAAVARISMSPERLAAFRDQINALLKSVEGGVD